VHALQLLPLSGQKGLYRGPRPSQIEAAAPSDARLPFRVLAVSKRFAGQVGISGGGDVGGMFRSDYALIAAISG
jgi:hypothetical protein